MKINNRTWNSSCEKVPKGGKKTSFVQKKNTRANGNFFREANCVATLHGNFISLKLSGTSLITYSANSTLACSTKIYITVIIPI